MKAETGNLATARRIPRAVVSAHYHSFLITAAEKCHCRKNEAALFFLKQQQMPTTITVLSMFPLSEDVRTCGLISRAK